MCGHIVLHRYIRRDIAVFHPHSRATTFLQTATIEHIRDLGLYSIQPLGYPQWNITEFDFLNLEQVHDHSLALGNRL